MEDPRAPESREVLEQIEQARREAEEVRLHSIRTLDEKTIWLASGALVVVLGAMLSQDWRGQEDPGCLFACGVMALVASIICTVASLWTSAETHRLTVQSLDKLTLEISRDRSLTADEWAQRQTESLNRERKDVRRRQWMSQFTRWLTIASAGTLSMGLLLMSMFAVAHVRGQTMDSSRDSTKVGPVTPGTPRTSPDRTQRQGVEGVPRPIQTPQPAKPPERLPDKK